MPFVKKHRYKRCWIFKSIDGVTHGSEEARERDLTRQAKLESFGVSFLRFYDGDVKENLQGVLTEIESWVRGHVGTGTSP